jgi:thiopurine S-methyltransferase
MNKDFWLERWKKNEVGFHQQEINTHLQEFWGRLNLPTGRRVFVPLCGKSRDMLWLRAQDYQLLGVEISPIAVHDFYTENQLIPRLSKLDPFERWESDLLVILAGDFFDLTAKLLKGVSGVYDRASLVAFPPEMRVSYATHLKAILPARAEILLVTMEYSQNEMQGPPFAVSENEVIKLYQSHYQIDRLYQRDILNENPRFRDQGLSCLVEKVYHLIPNQ